MIGRALRSAGTMVAQGRRKTARVLISTALFLMQKDRIPRILIALGNWIAPEPQAEVIESPVIDRYSRR
jgi:hypothetical protein